MAVTRLFYSNRTQAVRLARDVAFPEGVENVEVRVVGDSRVISPVGGDWEYWLEQGTRVTDDFCERREQPEMQHRAWDD